MCIAGEMCIAGKVFTAGLECTERVGCIAEDTASTACSAECTAEGGFYMME